MVVVVLLPRSSCLSRRRRREQQQREARRVEAEEVGQQAMPASPSSPVLALRLRCRCSGR